LPNTKTTTKST